MQKIHVCPLVTSLVVVVALYAVPAMAQIEINDIDELQLIGNDPGYPLDGDYVLGNDIDASATASWNGGEGFIPIAPDTDPLTGGHQGTAYAGTFDGQGYTISNLAINRPEEPYVGLFGFIAGATIQNVALENVDVAGADYVGGLVGYIYGGYNVTSCNSTGVVSGADQVGSLVGEIYDGCNVTNCYSACSVSGNVAVGGIVGFASENINITGCYSTGVVSGDRAVGGIVGTAGSFTSITSSYSTGAVSGSDSVGGLVGDSESGTIITSSYSMGAVSGNDTVGGLVGRAYGFMVNTSYSTGAVSGSNYVGGLVGMAWPGSITNCYSAGAVSGDSCVGGLVGFVKNGNITNCYSAGAVSGMSVGGLVGCADSSSITDCYWDIQTSGQTVSASGTGKTTAEMMQQVTFVNWDFVTVWDICEGGSYPFFGGNLTPFPIETTINVAASQADPTNTLPLVYDVVFSRPITGFDADDGDDVDVDFSGSTTTVTGYTVTNSGDNMHYTVEVTGIEGDGVIVATIPPAIITDSCFAMSNSASTSVDNNVTYDITPPAITIGPPTQTVVTQGDFVWFNVDYIGEASSWLTETDIALDVTGDVTAMVTVTSAKDSSYIVILSNIAGGGTLGFTIAAATAIDAAGNFATAASAPVLVTAEPEVPVSAVPLAVLLLGAGVAALKMRRRNK